MGSQETGSRAEAVRAPSMPPTGELDPEIVALADRLHSTAIHLLRRVRGEDVAMGLTPPRASALSVIVFGGAVTLGELAAAEQVRPPTVSRLVRDLEEAGLVMVRPDPRDGRVRVAEATAEGRALLTDGRARRVAHLARALAALTVPQRRTLVRAAGILEKVVIPEGRPGPGG